MVHTLTVELSDAAYAALSREAQASGTSSSDKAAEALEQQFSQANGVRAKKHLQTEAEKQAARERFERHFGEVNLGHATGIDNEAIDADLTRAFSHP